MGKKGGRSVVGTDLVIDGAAELHEVITGTKDDDEASGLRLLCLGLRDFLGVLPPVQQRRKLFRVHIIASVGAALGDQDYHRHRGVGELIIERTVPYARPARENILASRPGRQDRHEPAAGLEPLVGRIHEAADPAPAAADENGVRIGKLAPRLGRASQQQQQAAQQSQSGQSRQAQQSGEQASQSLQQASERMTRSSQSAQAERDARQLAAVRRAAQVSRAARGRPETFVRSRRGAGAPLIARAVGRTPATAGSAAPLRPRASRRGAWAARPSGPPRAR